MRNENTSTDYYGDLFLSFHSADRETVRQIQRLLHARGLSTFLDQDDLRRGLPWPQALEQALGQCKAVAVFLGAELGRWQRREIGFALDLQVEREEAGQAFPVIPILLPGTDPGHSFLFLNTWVDLRRDPSNPEEIDALATAVRGEVPAAMASARGIEDVCPYRGLQPFGEEHAAFFCGRDAFSQELLSKLQAERLVSVVGSSGSGKSSVVMAGLVPLLRRLRPPQLTWEVLRFTPGVEPFRRLAREFVVWLEPELGAVALAERAEDLGGKLERGDRPLALYLEEVLRATGSDRLLVVCDQFEELFAARPALQRPFLRCLLEALSNSWLRLVVTLRADFYGAAIDLDRELSELLAKGSVHLGPLRREEVLDVITRPAKLVGLGWDQPLLAEKIRDEVGEEPGKLPLLEYALLELWNGRSQGKLTADRYRDIGWVAGAIAVRADAVYKGLGPEQRETARRLMIRLVRTSASTKGLENTRQRIRLGDLGEAFQPVIAAFAAPDVRLLVTSCDEAGRETVEVAHEALIRAWGRLQHWLAEDTEFRLWRQRLEPSLEYFARDPGNVLIGLGLSEAERWHGERSKEFLPSELRLIETSLAERRRSDEQEEERRQNTLRHVKIAWLAVAVSVALALVAWFGLYRAQHQERLARRAASKARIALAAEALKENRPADALAHLAYALRRDPGWKALRAFTVNLLQNYPLPRVVRSPDGKIYDHAFGSEGPRMVTASAGGTAQLWDLWNGKAIGAPLGVGGEVFDARIGGQWVLTVARDHTVQVWEASSGRPVGVRVRPEVEVIKVKFLPGGGNEPRVGTEYPGGWRQFWNMSTGKPEGPPHRGWLYSGWVATEDWSPDARWKARTPQRNFVQVGEVGGEVLLPAMPHAQPIAAVDFSADGRWLLTRSDSNIERIWEAFRGKAVGAVDWKRVIRSATSNQAKAVGPYRVILTPEGRVQILEAASVALVVTLGSSEAASFRSAELGPDGKWVVTVSPDNSVRVWEAESGVPVSVAMEHRKEVTRAAFSHDARWVVTTQADGTVRVWSTLITPEKEAALLAEVVEALGGVVATDTGLEHLTGWEQRLDDVRRRAMLEPPNKPTVLSLAHWLFSDPWERTVQPLSTTTVPEYICEALRNGAWNEAYRYFPEHPLLRNGENGPPPAKCTEER